MTVIVCSVSYWANSRALFSGMSTTVRAGNCIGLVGPNGSGKTTFLDGLLGLRRFAAGSVKWQTPHRVVDITRWSASRRVALGFRRVFQKSPVLPERPSRMLLEAVEHSQQPLGPAMRELQDVVRNAKGKAQDFSFGEVRLLLSALALGSGGAVVLLDEPFEGLASEWKSVLKNALREQLGAGCMMAIADHDRDSVEEVSTSVIDFGRSSV